MPSEVFPISSRKIVPPCASSKRPGFLRSAPVKEPFSCPKSSDSASVSGSAAQLNWMNGPVRARREGVEDPRDEVLAGPRLAPDEDGHRAGRGARERRLHPLRRLGAADESVEVPAPAEVRLQALVLDGEAQARLEELLDEAGVLDGDRGEVGEGLEEGAVRLREEARGVAVVDVDRPGGPLLHEERDAEEGDDRVGVDRLAPHEARVDAGVGRADGAAVGDDPLDDGARDRLGLVLAPGLEVPRDADGEAARDGVGEEDHPALGVEPLEREVDDVLEDGREVARGVDDARDLVEADDAEAERGGPEGLGRGLRRDPLQDAARPLQLAERPDPLEEACRRPEPARPRAPCRASSPPTRSSSGRGRRRRRCRRGRGWRPRRGGPPPARAARGARAAPRAPG